MNHPSRQSRILVVDDEATSAYLVAVMASHYARDVNILTHSSDAIRVAEQWQPDIVLLDLMMPDPNGFEVARHLREKLPAMKIVAVTALPHSDNRVQSAGFDGHLIKPVLKESLNGVLRQLLSHP